MTPQQIFNRAVKLFRRGETIRFNYRDENGCKCVVGHFMSDACLDRIDEKKMDGTDVYHLDVDSIRLPKVIRENIDLFNDLQRHNDGCDLYSLASIAEEHGLEMP